MRNLYETFVSKPDEKRPFGKSRRRMEIILKYILPEILLGLDSSDTGQKSVVGSFKHGY
jgi:hypothetical protein